jgi:hypothetical protein
MAGILEVNRRDSRCSLRSGVDRHKRGKIQYFFHNENTLDLKRLGLV